MVRYRLVTQQTDSFRWFRYGLAGMHSVAVATVIRSALRQSGWAEGGEGWRDEEGMEMEGGREGARKWAGGGR